MLKSRTMKIKPHPDSLQRFLFEQSHVRGELVHLDDAWREVLKRHDYPPALRAVMGELMAAAVLLAATLKLKGALILQIQGQGPVTLLVVECDGELNVRATAKWQGELEGTGFAQMVGDGRFVITLDPRDGGQTYQGIVELDGDSVAGVLQNYMLRSDQLETRLWLAADEHGAAGLLLQKMPGEGGFAPGEQDEDMWQRVTLLTDTLRSEELLGLPAVELIRRLYREEDVRLFDTQQVAFRCSCSRDRVARMLKMLGWDEVQSVLAEQGMVEVRCEFCNHQYLFDKVDAEQVFAAEVLLDASAAVH
ncbi:MAG: 33 kDa chaperonin [Candidatus Gallionella acididurans]|uniref:33 kDa chaperonin n=1 Tax=Candidatus Gallionella acididurans TaxID=1796491 RepID=A0A139BU61_9PROT|nr:MAG: 33 kDa chaperonin [Candidatus Gallionella acididurans]